jgi:hypothetical protein
LTGVIIKQSLLEGASGLELYRKVIDYSAAAGSRDQAGTWLSDPCMRLTEFGKAIAKGQGQEAGADFLKECVWAEADFARDMSKVIVFALFMKELALPLARSVVYAPSEASCSTPLANGLFRQ